MKVKLWGVRGSLPMPESPEKLNDRIVHQLENFAKSKARSVTEFVETLPLHVLGGYGGNTSCVEIKAKNGDQRLIIDCGSGLKELGVELMKGPAAKGQAEISLLMTHFHWDHVIGLPFFVPIFIPGNKITFYGVQEDLEACIRQMFTKPFFPVDFELLPSKIEFKKLEPRKQIEISGFKTTAYELDHPDPCWGYRIERDGRAYAHCVDTEATRISKTELGEDLGLYTKANLMVFDGQYTLMEVIEKVNWGHAVAGLGLDIAMREQVDRVVFVHHDPYASHSKIQEAILQTERYYELRAKECRAAGETVHAVEWQFGYEGLEVEV